MTVATIGSCFCFTPMSEFLPPPFTGAPTPAPQAGAGPTPQGPDLTNLDVVFSALLGTFQKNVA